MVYGSLLSGLHNHSLIANGELLGEHETDPEFTMFSLRAFPGVVHRGSTKIKGEVYEVNKQTFKALDSLEGYPSFYNRELINTPYGEAWIYLINDSYEFNREVVDDGDWRRYYQEDGR